MRTSIESYIEHGNRLAAVLAAASLLVVAACGVARADATDDYVHRQMAEKQIPGLALAVIRDGRVVKEAAYGKASLELHVPMTIDNSFHLQSMAKLFTAAAVMQLVEEGRISLDEPVIKILPQLPSAWSAVTVRHCLSHTSGLPDLFTDALNLETVSGDRDTAIADLAKLPLKAVGVEAVYNQTGYMLLGMIIEKISGSSYENFLRDRILGPTGMKNASKTASWGDGWAVIPGLATLYTKVDITPDHTRLLVRDGRPVLTDKVLRYGSYHLPSYLAPAGYVNGSLHDLVNWEAALSQGKLLKPATLADMTKPYKLAGGKDGIFALGYVSVPMNLFDTGAAKFGPYRTVSYGGGSATFCMSIPEKHLTVIVLTNLEGASPQYLAADIATLFEPSLLAAAAH